MCGCLGGGWFCVVFAIGGWGVCWGFDYSMPLVFAFLCLFNCCLHLCWLSVVCCVVVCTCVVYVRMRVCFARVASCRSLVSSMSAVLAMATK